MTNQQQIRAAFWAAFPNLPRQKYKWKTQKESFYLTDTRCAFVDYVDQLQRAGEITEALANRVTL